MNAYIDGMGLKRTSLILALLAAPAFAQDAPEGDSGRDLMAEALNLFIRGFMAEMEPALEDLEGFIEDLNGYHPPEVLPNGDIIIRRKVPKDVPGENVPDSEVEL